MKWYGIEFHTKNDAKALRYFRNYLQEKGYRFESCGCYCNTLLSIFTDENGVYALNNVLDDYYASATE